MESEVELEKAKNEVLRKIGRNILHFQEIEQMLKFLIANGKIEGTISEVRANQEQRAATVKKQTMGQLVGQYIEDFHSENEENTAGQAELSEPYFSFSFTIESDSFYCESRKQALASIVADRNELIHHLLPRLNQNSIESWANTDRYLDLQLEKLLPEIDSLKSIIETMQELKQEQIKYFDSDEGKRQIELSWLRQSRLVIMLGEIAAQAARQDGWTLLNTAGQLIRQYMPEEMAKLNDKYGHKTLKGLILAVELFDITEELTDKGGIRVLYRLKNEWVLQNS